MLKVRYCESSAASLKWRLQENTHGSGHETHAPIDGLLIVLWILHLTHDWQKSTCSSARAEDRGRRHHASSEGRMANYVVAKVKIAGLGSRSWPVECGDTNAAKR